jgi:hypothetical protein
MATTKKKKASTSGLGSLEKTKASLRKELQAARAKKSAITKQKNEVLRAAKRKKQLERDIEKMRNELKKERGVKVTPRKKARR